MKKGLLIPVVTILVIILDVITKAAIVNKVAYHEIIKVLPTVKDLGYDVEFYSQLRLDYRLASNARVGLGVGHISNAGIGDKNPGAETAYLSYRFDF